MSMPALRAPGSSRKLAVALRRHAVDLVHVSLSFSSLDFTLPELCHDLGLPVVATFHAPFDTRPTRWGVLSSLLYRLYAAPLSRFDRIVVFGPRQRDMLASIGVPGAALRIVPNGVDTERYSPLRHRPPNPLDADRLFTFAGRVDPEKNVDTLVEAFLAVNPPAGVRLAVMGEGGDRRRLQRRYRDRRVAFLGRVALESERVALLRASEAFFLPSAIEGLSLALLEAMACGVCPVATDVGCDGDAVEGVGILLDPMALASDLRMAMRLLLHTPRLGAELGALARRRAVERYSLARNVDALLALYDELTSTGASGAPPANGPGVGARAAI